MKQHLRVAMVFSVDPSQSGGIQEHVMYLTDALRARGHDVTLIGPKIKKHTFEQFISLGKHVTMPRLLEFTKGALGSFHTLEGDGVKFDKIFSPKKFDLVHLQAPYKPYAQWVILKHLKLPTIMTVHEAWTNTLEYNILQTLRPIFKNLFADQISGVISVSGHTRNCWSPIWNPNTPTGIIPNGIDTAVFYPASRKQTKKREILFLARIVPKKGLRFLLRAMRTILHDMPDVHLTVVGEGPEKEKMEQYTESQGLSGYVTFTGRVSVEDKVRYLQQADVFCAPYEDEGFGITLLEALTCGCPVVGFMDEPYREWLGKYPGKQFLVTPRDTKALARALVKVLSDASLRIKLRNWGIREGKKYAWEHIAAQTELFYRQTLK